MPGPVLGTFTYINSFYLCNNPVRLINVIIPTLRKKL